MAPPYPAHGRHRHRRPLQGTRAPRRRPRHPPRAAGAQSLPIHTTTPPHHHTLTHAHAHSRTLTHTHAHSRTHAHTHTPHSTLHTP
eukprot:4936892-Prymnesium_polylepis.1